MNHNVIYSNTFSNEIIKLSRKYQNLVFKKIQILRANPKHPSLRTKKLIRANNETLFESSVNMDIRLVWRYEDDKIILMLDVGHHDILKKY